MILVLGLWVKDSQIQGYVHRALVNFAQLDSQNRVSGPWGTALRNRGWDGWGLNESKRVEDEDEINLKKQKRSKMIFEP